MKKFHAFFLASLLAAGASTLRAQDAVYEIDPVHSTVLAHVVGKLSWIFIFLLLVGCGSGSSSSSAPPSVAATGTPEAQADVGERLFV